MYIDYRLDTDKPFYVGKGLEGRAKSIKRNQRHVRIAEKHGMRREIVIATRDENFAWEQESRLISELKTRNHFGGANFTDGGEGARGRKHSAESIAKMRGRKLSDEHRQKLSLLKRGNKARLGMKTSDETRAKMSAAHKGKCLSEEHKQKIGEINRTKVRTPEMRAKISRGQIGRTVSEETRAKIAAKLRGHIVSPETREKIGQRHRERHACQSAQLCDTLTQEANDDHDQSEEYR